MKNPAMMPIRFNRRALPRPMSAGRSTAYASIFCLAVVAGGCGPSIDAAAKADVDRRLARMQSSERAFAAPADATPLPLAVGQWVTYKFVDDKGQPSFMTLKLVGETGGAYWYETLGESYYGTTATRMLLDFGDRKGPESVTIKTAKIRLHDGNVVDYPESVVGMMNSLLRGNLGPVVINFWGMPQEDVTATAGRFARCYRGTSEVQFAGFKASSLVWGHPAIPFSGMVKSQGDDGSRGELVDFGTSGAVSSF